MIKKIKTLRVHPQDEITPEKSIKELLTIMARLRGRDGCPWDREQTENTLKKFLIEEAYEVVEAIEEGNPGDLKEELGDLLLQIVFLSQIADEKGQFQFVHVVQILTEKLIRRHPHIFPPKGVKEQIKKPKDGQEVKELWREIKKLEGKSSVNESLLDRIPLSLPALERAERIARRVARVGFDWPNIEEVFEKVKEELNELDMAKRASSPKEMERELGDVFLALVNWARFQGISAEEAVRKANRRFVRRFQRVELELRRRGRTPAKSSLEEMEYLWNEVKKKEKRPKKM